MSKTIDRRTFLKSAALAGGAATLLPAAPKQATKDSETLVAQLYSTLGEKQRAGIVFPFDHPLRSKVDNNWHITPHKIGRFFTPDQQALVSEIYRGLHSPEFSENAFRRLSDDAGGIANYSLALFGEPGAGKFEFVMTGRHCTARCDGDSVEGAAFGGPIFYGHAPQDEEEPDHPGNVFWRQAKSANRVFQALGPKQREAALLNRGRHERGTATVTFKSGEYLRGLPVSDMSRDQRELVEKTLEELLAPFRAKDRAETMKLIRSHGGVESLWMSFYRNGDIGGDGVWQLESPKMVWYFRGAPHVHVWVNVRA